MTFAEAIELERRIQSAREEYLTAVEADERQSVIRAKADAITVIRTELNNRLTEGTTECSCGSKPIGMIQVGPGPRNTEIRYIEIGCPVCRDTVEQSFRSIGSNPEEAVANWNAGKRLPPKKPAS
jgi:hypothetical protein